MNTIPAYRFDIEVRGNDIIVNLPSARFTAIYYKAAGQPELILRQRTKCDDDEVIARALQAADSKARKLGWIA